MNLENNYPSKQWKFCPYCGSKNIDWGNGTQCVVCADCKRNFFINAASAVIAVIKDDKGRTLFAKRARDPEIGKLDFPGGFVDINEKAEDAVIREIKEELNLKVTETKYLFSMPNRYKYKEIVYFTLDLIFECKVEGLEKIQANDDVSEYYFLAKEDVNIDDIGLESAKKVAKLVI